MKFLRKSDQILKEKISIFPKLCLMCGPSQQTHISRYLKSKKTRRLLSVESQGLVKLRTQNMLWNFWHHCLKIKICLWLKIKKMKNLLLRKKSWGVILFWRPLVTQKLSEMITLRDSENTLEFGSTGKLKKFKELV